MHEVLGSTIRVSNNNNKTEQKIDVDRKHVNSFISPLELQLMSHVFWYPDSIPSINVYNKVYGGREGQQTERQRNN